MKINAAACLYPLDGNFVAILEREIEEHAGGAEAGVVLTFKDDDYDPVDGGFHPVELRITPGGRIEYITDFAYVGAGPFAELAKEIDFDFSLGLFQHFGREFPIAQGLELYRLWEQNFVSYHGMGVYRVIVAKN